MLVLGAPWPTWLGWFMNPGLVIAMVIFILWIEGHRNLQEHDIEEIKDERGQNK